MFKPTKRLTFVCHILGISYQEYTMSYVHRLPYSQCKYGKITNKWV